MSERMSSTEIVNGWDAAIKDAKEALRRTQEKVVRLKVAIESFEESKSRGEPWPGTQLPDQTSERQHNV